MEQQVNRQNSVVSNSRDWVSETMINTRMRKIIERKIKLDEIYSQSIDPKQNREILVNMIKSIKIEGNLNKDGLLDFLLTETNQVQEQKVIPLVVKQPRIEEQPLLLNSLPKPELKVDLKTKPNQGAKMQEMPIIEGLLPIPSETVSYTTSNPPNYT